MYMFGCNVFVRVFCMHASACSISLSLSHCISLSMCVCVCVRERERERERERVFNSQNVVNTLRADATSGCLTVGSWWTRAAAICSLCNIACITVDFEVGNTCTTTRDRFAFSCPPLVRIPPNPTSRPPPVTLRALLVEARTEW
jgi:hypothetical protein